MKFSVGILGATGTVGQRFIQMLSRHPWFDLRVLAASKRSAGKKYAEAANWLLDTEIPDEIANEEVVLTDVKEVRKVDDVDIVFSALPSDVARGIEMDFASEGVIVSSNSSALRMEEDVPLVIPEVNPDHLKIIDYQKEKRNWEGFVVTNPNCSAIPLTLVLKPIYEKFGIEKVWVTTMQAISGAGYPGVASMEILDNVIPYISGEEDKVEKEPLKILGKLENNKFEFAEFTISASCNRVPVMDGHLESVFLITREKADLNEIINILKNFRSLPQDLGLPTAPKNPIYLFEEKNRPQPRLDRNLEGGMSVSVGRIRRDISSEKGIKFTVLGHNSIRGAAGASILNAELIIEKYL
ncbi:MAG: aspartate-semialdehyde dehydrogenase [Candidatus Hydrothermarchaeota archaeon]